MIDFAHIIRNTKVCNLNRKCGQSYCLAITVKSLLGSHFADCTRHLTKIICSIPMLYIVSLEARNLAPY